MRDFLLNLFVITLSFSMILNAKAEDLGIVGQTYVIAEEDFLQLIETRYQTMQENGEWEEAQKGWQKQILYYADRPNPIHSITTTITPRSYQVDPSLTLSRDIIGLEGVIIAKAGTVINPLAIMTLHKVLLFINADDPKQIAWAIKKDKEQEGKTKWILVKGSVGDTVKKLHKPIFFDQGGKLTKYFKIQQVPALLKQEGIKLKIMEMKP